MKGAREILNAAATPHEPMEEGVWGGGCSSEAILSHYRRHSHPHPLPPPTPIPAAEGTVRFRCTLNDTAIQFLDQPLGKILGRALSAA